MLKNLMALIALVLSTNIYAQDTQVKEVKKICEGLPQSEKVIVAIVPFKTAARNISQQVATGFPDMMSNAIFNTGCFRVVDRDRLNQTLAEQNIGESGAGDENSFAKVGKLIGAQVLVMGTITEFNEKAGGNSIGAGALNLIGNKFGVGHVREKSVTSSISYTLKFVDPNTGEILDTKSFNKTNTAIGLSGGGIFAGGSGIGAGGASFFQSKSMQNALESSLIEAVEYMSKNKSAYADLKRPQKASEAETPKFNKAGCSILTSGHIPKVMVIIPEYHITQRIPDPAAETEINRIFIEAGFHVVDPAIYASLNNSIEFKDAAGDPARAISIGRKFGADIVIYGEAFSQRPGRVNRNNAGTLNGMSSCRARVEVKAVRTDNAEMVATNGMEAGAVDNAEFVAAKIALRKAGALVADYLLVQFCSKNLSFSTSGITVSNGKSTTEITLFNADYSKLRALATVLSQKYKVTSKSIVEGKGIIEVEHTGETQAIADFIDDRTHSQYSIQNVEMGRISLTAK